MPDIVIRTRIPLHHLHAALANLPAVCSGHVTAPATDDAVRRLHIRAGNAILKVIHNAFKVKRRGNTDAAGLRWPDLKYKKPPRKDMLKLTGDLEDSLAPSGRTTTIPQTTYTIFQIQGSAIKIGTARPHALEHHNGTWRLPQRRLWPTPDKWPSAWRQEIGKAVAKGVVDVIRALLRK